MSYQVIARKWRPQAFSELVGQEAISQTLSNAMTSGRVPHALLFTGPRGTGKTSTARILAKSLRCPNVVDLTPCNQCSECDLIGSGQSVDVIEIDGASNNGVDAIRELREGVGYRPSHGTYKIYIIDEVHMLSGSAFNALLKTLEEPPEHVLFIMATTEAHKIPNTILSRCQRFDFRRIPTRKISQHLIHICEKENVRFEPEAIWSIARQGDGSMRDSQSLLDQVITFSSKNITNEIVTQALGLTDRGLLTRTVEALCNRDLSTILKIVESIYISGLDVKVFSADLLEEIRHLLLTKLNPESPQSYIELPDSEIDFLKSLAQKLKEEDIHMLFDMALKGTHDIGKTTDSRIVLEMLLLRMAQAPRWIDLKSLLNENSEPEKRTNPPLNVAKSQIVESTRVDLVPKMTPPKMEKKLSEVLPEVISEPIPEVKSETTAENPVGFYNSQISLSENWLHLVNKVRKLNSVIAAKLEHSYPISYEDGRLTVAIPVKFKFLHQQITEPDFQKKLTNYLKTFWGTQIQLEIKLEGEQRTENLTPKQLTQKTETDEKAKIRADVESHPLVQKTKSIFNVQIQDIKEIKP